MSIHDAFLRRWWPWSKNRNDWTAGLPVVPVDPTAKAAEEAQRDVGGQRRLRRGPAQHKPKHSKAKEGR